MADGGHLRLIVRLSKLTASVIQMVSSRQVGLPLFATCPASAQADR